MTSPRSLYHSIRRAPHQMDDDGEFVDDALGRAGLALPDDAELAASLLASAEALPLSAGDPLSSDAAVAHEQRAGAQIAASLAAPPLTLDALARARAAGALDALLGVADLDSGGAGDGDEAADHAPASPSAASPARRRARRRADAAGVVYAHDDGFEVRFGASLRASSSLEAQAATEQYDRDVLAESVYAQMADEMSRGEHEHLLRMRRHQEAAARATAEDAAETAKKGRPGEFDCGGRLRLALCCAADEAAY